MMGSFSKYFDVLQSAILSTEATDDVGQPCQCDKEIALYRCMDCSFSPVLCGTCVVASHVSNPFHHIQKWNGFYLHRISLSDLGHTIQLGHRSAACPSRLSGSKGRATTIVHVNGIHQVCIEYCRCVHALPEPEQLARSSLFPASFERPETAFTFSVLKQFHILGSTAKTPAYDFINALVNMTDNAFPKNVPVSKFYMTVTE